jgi:hypothetical protein
MKRVKSRVVAGLLWPFVAFAPLLTLNRSARAADDAMSSTWIQGVGPHGRPVAVLVTRFKDEEGKMRLGHGCAGDCRGWAWRSVKPGGSVADGQPVRGTRLDPSPIGPRIVTEDGMIQVPLTDLSPTSESVARSLREAQQASASMGETLAAAQQQRVAQDQQLRDDLQRAEGARVQAEGIVIGTWVAQIQAAEAKVQAAVASYEAGKRRVEDQSGQIVARALAVQPRIAGRPAGGLTAPLQQVGLAYNEPIARVRERLAALPAGPAATPRSPPPGDPWLTSERIFDLDHPWRTPAGQGGRDLLEDATVYSKAAASFAASAETFQMERTRYVQVADAAIGRADLHFAAGEDAQGRELLTSVRHLLDDVFSYDIVKDRVSAGSVFLGGAITGALDLRGDIDLARYQQAWEAGRRFGPFLRLFVDGASLISLGALVSGMGGPTALAVATGAVLATPVTALAVAGIAAAAVVGGVIAADALATLIEGSEGSGERHLLNEGDGEASADTETSDKPALTREQATSFRGGRYASFKVQQDTVLYRAGWEGEPFGSYYTRLPAVSEVQVRIDSGVLA